MTLEYLQKQIQKLGCLENVTIPLESRCQAVLEEKTGAGCAPAEMLLLMDRVEALEQITTGPKFVWNKESDCVHNVHRHGDSFPSETWRTRCKWKFATSQFEVLMDLSSAKDLAKCERCWPEMAKKARKTSGAKESDSSMSSEQDSSSSTSSSSS